MASALFLALLLVAGSSQNSFVAGEPNINFPEISLPDINWPLVIESIPINVRDIVANIAGIVGAIRNIDWPAIIDQFPEIDWAALLDRLPEIDWAALLDKLSEINWEDLISQIPNINWADLINLIPEINWADILDKLPEINLPELLDRLREILGNLDIDWAAIIDQLPIELDRDLGEPAQIEEFPSAVQIEIGTGSIWVQGCVGSILNVGYILSNARCFTGKMYQPSNRRIRAGATERGRDGVVFSVSYAINHPTFGYNHYDGDIAVVRILGYFTYGPTIQRVAITGQGAYFPPGVRVMNAGWGTSSQGSLISNRRLHKADMVVVDNWECAAMYANSTIPIIVSYNTVCVGREQSRGRSAGLRDMGAPLYYNGILMGIQSFGRYVSNGNFPIVATFISSYTTWIAETAN